MLPSSREITFHSAISCAHVSHDYARLDIMDDACHLHSIDLTQLKVLKSALLSNHYREPLFDYYKRPFALGERIAYFPFEPKGKEHVIDIRSKIAPLGNFSYNSHEVVTQSALNENDTLLITGNERGRTYLIDPHEGTIQAELPIGGDSISAVALSDAYNLAARASFSRDLVIYHTQSFRVLFEQKMHSVIEAMIFVSEEILIAITRDRTILKIDIFKNKILKEVSLEQQVWPSCITLSFSKKFIYVGTRESILFAIYTKTLDVLYQVKLPYHGITTLSRTQSYFIMGFKTGELLFYNHREFEEQFITHIKLRQIKEACLLFEKNIFLMSHRETKKIYEYWLEEKESIINLLARGEIEEAQNIAEPFLFHPKCKLEFNEIELLQPDLMSLQRCIRSLHYAAAYDLVRVKSELRKSSLFIQLEALWKKNLQQAQILLARDPLHNKEAAREVLSAFEDVDEKKLLIENMLKRSNIFAMADHAVKEKNFTYYFRLVAQNNFLETTPMYQKVLEVAERVQKEILKYLESEGYKQALILADILNQFTPYHNQAHRLKEVSKALLILQHQVEHHQFFEALKTQEQFNLQSHYLPIQSLEKLKAHFFAEQVSLLETKSYEKVWGNVSSCMSLSLCHQPLSALMKKFYISEMQDAYAEHNDTIDWEKTFVTYLFYFPNDKALMDFAKQAQKEEILKHIIPSPKEQITHYPKTILTLYASKKS